MILCHFWGLFKLKRRPKKQADLPLEQALHWMFREEITVEDSLVLKKIQIIIPEAKRSNVLKKFHEGHLVVEVFAAHKL